MKINKKNIIFLFSLTVIVAFLSGCAMMMVPLLANTPGAIGSASTEMESEKVTKAEYKFEKKDKGKILVLVYQPGWIKTPMDLRPEITKYINQAFADKEKGNVKKERLIEYKEVLNTRMALPESQRDEPNAISKKLGAKYILYVQVMDFDLSTFAEKDFYNGMLAANTCLLDANGVKVWPDGKDNRTTKVEIEDEKGTMEKAVAKLTAATAHCVVRYFYDCKTVRFRIQEEHRELENTDL